MGEVYSTFTSQKQIIVGAFPDGRAVSVEVFDNSIDLIPTYRQCLGGPRVFLFVFCVCRSSSTSAPCPKKTFSQQDIGEPCCERPPKALKNIETMPKAESITSSSALLEAPSLPLPRSTYRPLGSTPLLDWRSQKIKFSRPRQPGSRQP